MQTKKNSNKFAQVKKKKNQPECKDLFLSRTSLLPPRNDTADGLNESFRGVVSSAARKKKRKNHTHGEKESGHVDAARRAYTVLPCVSWGTLFPPSGVFMPERNDRDARLIDTSARCAITSTNERKTIFTDLRGKIREMLAVAALKKSRKTRR